MNVPGISKLMGSTDDLGEHVSQPEISDQHGNRKSFLSARKASRPGRPLLAEFTAKLIAY
jgi:hypothetical protein